MNFAQNLKALRDERDIGQTKLAERLHVTQATVSRWETGEICPMLETLCALADYFHITTDQLLGRAPLPETGPRKVKVRKIQKKGKCV